MINTKMAFSLVCFLITLAFLSYYFAASPKNTLLDDETLSRLPDAIISNLTVTQYDIHGQPANRLTTMQLTHLPQDNTHWLTSPQIQILKENNENWHITAKRAKAIHGFEKITFMKNVIVNQSNPKNTVPTTFKTEELFYFPQKKLAVSTVNVLFEQAGNQVASKGMKAWLGEERIQLLSKTHAIYQPTKNT